MIPAAEAPAGGWYVGRGKQKQGPFTSAQLRALAAAGKLLADDNLSRDGKQWVTADSISGLMPMQDSAEAPTPEPSAPKRHSKKVAGPAKRLPGAVLLVAGGGAALLLILIAAVAVGGYLLFLRASPPNSNVIVNAAMTAPAVPNTQPVEKPPLTAPVSKPPDTVPREKPESTPPPEKPEAKPPPPELADEEKTAAVLEKLGYKLRRDETLPGRPVVAVSGTGWKLRGERTIDANSPTPEAIEALCRLTQLNSMTFDTHNFADGALKRLAAVDRLRSLTLSQCSATEAGFKELKEL
jgi:hypothetical protein